MSFQFSFAFDLDVCVCVTEQSCSQHRSRKTDFVFKIFKLQLVPISLLTARLLSLSHSRVLVFYIFSLNNWLSDEAEQLQQVVRIKMLPCISIKLVREKLYAA